MRKISIVLVCLIMVSWLVTGIVPLEAKADTTINCPNCGRKTPVEARMCLFCGASIHQAQKATTSVDIELGDVVVFGAYEQDNRHSNGKEPIEWIVISIDENMVLLLSRYALDCKPFNTYWAETTWEASSLRQWLNEDFLYSAFSEGEISLISPSYNVAHKNPDYKTDPGRDTVDKVFLLSVDEVKAFPVSTRKCQGTAYCYAQGAFEAGNGNCFWWLRTPGWFEKSAADINQDGLFAYDEGKCKGYNVNHSGHAVRPALWIDLG